MITVPTENYNLAKTTKSILKKNNIKLNKNLGQNYLIDDYKLDKILNSAELTKNDTVLEIGSGIGTLTLELSKKSKKIISIEKDPTIFKMLEKRVDDNNINNIELINDDALNIDFPKFDKVVSNLPYQISSPITFKFLEYDFKLGVLMYQKEFGNHMVAKFGTKSYSRLSAMLYYKTNVEIIDNVPAESFIPKPKVNSVILKLTPKENIISNEEYEYYGVVCKALFQHKNKKSRNALIDSRQVLGYDNKKVLKKKLELIDDDLLLKRPVNMSPNEILSLSRMIRGIL